jgi:hypothetical protein
MSEGVGGVERLICRFFGGRWDVVIGLWYINAYGRVLIREDLCQLTTCFNL